MIQAWIAEKMSIEHVQVYKEQNLVDLPPIESTDAECYLLLDKYDVPVILIQYGEDHTVVESKNAKIAVTSKYTLLEIVVEGKTVQFKIPFQAIVLHALDSQKTDLYLQVDHCLELLACFGTESLKDESAVLEVHLKGCQDGQKVYRALCDGAKLNSSPADDGIGGFDEEHEWITAESLAANAEISGDDDDDAAAVEGPPAKYSKTSDL